MKLKDIFEQAKITKIFSVTDEENENPLKWTIEPTKLEVVPDEDGHFVVLGKQIYADKNVDCFVNIITPERISEIVVFLKNNKVVSDEISNHAELKSTLS